MPYRQMFGSWGKGLICAGLNPKKPKPPYKGRKKGSKNKKLKRVMSRGYVHIFKPDHIEAMKNGYVREHRMVVSDYIGRKLKKDEEIHHINGIKSDNRLENLQIISKVEHAKISNPLGSKRLRKNSKKCKFCNVLTGSKYGLCQRHYKLEWQRGNIHQYKHLLET